MIKTETGKTSTLTSNSQQLTHEIYLQLIGLQHLSYTCSHSILLRIIYMRVQLLCNN